MTGRKTYLLILLAMLLAGTQIAIGQTRQLTFYKDIQPIIYNNCTGCHRPGQSGPFSLISYNDVLKHANMIKHVTATGYMPPWKADTTYRRFTDERILCAADVQAISEWITNGAPAGNAADAVSLPVLDKTSNLGMPDFTVTAPEIFTVPGNNQDTVQYFVMHYTLPTDTNVQAFEFLPGNPLAVHHSNTWVFPEPSEYERIYEREPEPFVPAPIAWIYTPPTPEQMFLRIDTTLPPAPAGDFAYPDFFPKVAPLYYDGWVPGASARTWPPGFGFKLPNKGVIIMQIHYGPTPVERKDQSSINMFFTGKPITRVIESYNIGTGGGIAEPEPALILPPDSIKTFELTTELAEDQSYIALNPHMHYLGKEMKAYAVTPATDTIPLIWIRKWDFRWQEFYKPISPIHIPKGSILKIIATYDNTSANPDNHYNPPKQIVSGSNSTDEMMSLIIMSVRYREGDEKMILQSDMPVAAKKDSLLNAYKQ